MKVYRNLLPKIDNFSFQDTIISTENLKDLYDLFCTFEDEYECPSFSIDYTSASAELDDFEKNFIKKNKRGQEFLKKLRRDTEASMAAAFMRLQFKKLSTDQVNAENLQK